ncbi:hypothetical protein A5662_02685 [Mycobacteriaceae bacterium 1482268.1]|nr:hypothetical protein A5662_02685 [Mycobacteriaceae bacterium 1482268.1]
MAKLSNDELRELIENTEPDVVVDDTKRAAPAAPPGVRSMPDRSALAAKVARARGVDAPPQEPAPLTDDESQFFDTRVETAEGTSRKAAVVSRTTGRIIAEQG